MLYDVNLQIDYSYESPTDHSRNLLRILPPDISGVQRVLSRILSVDPLPAERYDGLDYFGNDTTSVVWHHPIKAFTLKLVSKVERFPPMQQLDFSPSLEALSRELGSVRSLTPTSPHHFTVATRRAPITPAMTEFARMHLAPGMTSLQAVHAIGSALHGEMTFDAEATDVDTPAETAFKNRHGVCQDFTHIMIACLRGIGIPAGYVSGFLRTYAPPGQAKLEGADATHAWVRAWVGIEMGWVEFDPTNNQPSGTDYITISTGRDYDDVAPVRGAMRGHGEQETSQAVDVVPLDIA